MTADNDFLNPYAPPRQQNNGDDSAQTVSLWRQLADAVYILMKAGAYGVIAAQLTVLAGMLIVVLIRTLTGWRIPENVYMPPTFLVGGLIGIAVIPCYVYFRFSRRRD